MADNMKRILVIVLLCAASLLSGAQEKKVDHSFQLGGGYYFRTLKYSKARTEAEGVAVQFSYGADFLLGKRWSVMPSIGISSVIETASPKMGGTTDRSSDIEFAVLARYRFAKRCIAGLGPMLSYSFDGTDYPVSIDDGGRRGRTRIYTPFSLSVKPQFAVDLGKHWRVGAESAIGLSNTYRDSGNTGISSHLYYFLATVGFHF